MWFCVCQVSIRYSRLQLRYSPLGVVACLLQGIAAALQGFLPIYPAGFGGAHQDAGAVCLYWCLHGPINSKYNWWGWSLTILQAAPPRWRCPAERNQGLPEHGEAWRFRFGSGSYPWNAFRQQALRCFAKCPGILPLLGICRKHKRRFGTIVNSSPDVHHQLGTWTLEALTR